MPPSTLSTLDRDRAAFLAAYDAFTPEQRAFRPADGGWTADDVAEHMARVETGLLAVLAKQVDAGAARRDVGTPSPAGQDRMMAYMRSEMRLPMPEALAPHVGPTGTDGTESRSAIAAGQVRWRSLEDRLAPEDAEAGLYRHPSAGAFTFAQTADFHAAHLDHHTRQLARIRASDGFPA